MNKRISIGITAIVLSFAVASVAIGLLAQQQHQAYAISQDSNTAQTLTIPGSNADDEPTILPSMIRDIVISIFKTIQD